MSIIMSDPDFLLKKCAKMGGEGQRGLISDVFKITAVLLFVS